MEAQKAVDKKYQDRDVWIASTIQNMVNMGFFSSDRTILEYAKNIWKIEPLKTREVSSFPLIENPVGLFPQGFFLC